MKKINELNLQTRHFVGIVSCIGAKHDYGFPWPAYLCPISNYSTGLHNIILHFAGVGVHSVWVILPKHTIPLVQSTIGNVVRDPKSVNIPFVKNRFYHERHVPIYYVPYPFMDKEIYNTFLHSIIYGVRITRKTCRHLSQWAFPSRFIVGSPFGLVPYKLLSNKKVQMKLKDAVYYYDKKSFLTNDFLPFTFHNNDLNKVFRRFRKAEKQKMSDVFGFLQNKEHFSVKPSFYYDISSWEGLMKWFANEGNEKRWNFGETMFLKNKALQIAENKWTRELFLDKTEKEKKK